MPELSVPATRRRGSDLSHEGAPHACMFVDDGKRLISKS